MSTQSGPAVTSAAAVLAAEQQARRFLDLLLGPENVIEVRAPRWNRYEQTASGYFDDAKKLIGAMAPLDGAANIYVTPNPVNPALFARASNRPDRRAQHTTSDKDAVRRRWLQIDIDSRRPSGISSTAEELAAAEQVLSSVTPDLLAAGWPDTVVIMSGNGYNALYPLDLPNDQEATQLVKAVLSALAARHNPPGAGIDIAVHNASRLVALPGALKVKGDSAPDRPHRRVTVVSIPEELPPVPRELLEAVAGDDPAGEAGGRRDGGVALNRPQPDLLRAAGVEYQEQAPDASGIMWYHVRQCPFHDDGSAFECGVGQELPAGRYTGHCFHPEGEGRGW